MADTTTTFGKSKFFVQLKKIFQSTFVVKLRKQLAALISLFLLVAIFASRAEYFLTLNNLLTVGLQTAVIGVIAVGMTYVVITGGIDLSVGSILAFSGMVVGFCIDNTEEIGGLGLPIVPAIVLGLLAGTLCGLANGFFIAKANIPPFISTLGLMITLRGLALIITNAKPIFIDSLSYELIAGGTIFGIVPYPVIYLLVIGVVFAFILRRTVVGKRVYALGSNEEAARLSGVNVVRTKLFVYGLSGFLCAVSSVILSSRLVSAQPTEGAGYELEAIAAVVIGGASLSGGRGTIIGTIIGAFIISVSRNGLNMLNVSASWQLIMIGIVILLTVFIDQRRRKLQKG